MSMNSKCQTDNENERWNDYGASGFLLVARSSIHSTSRFPGCEPKNQPTMRFTGKFVPVHPPVHGNASDSRVCLAADPNPGFIRRALVDGRSFRVGSDTPESARHEQQSVCGVRERHND